MDRTRRLEILFFVFLTTLVTLLCLKPGERERDRNAEINHEPKSAPSPSPIGPEDLSRVRIVLSLGNKTLSDPKQIQKISVVYSGEGMPTRELVWEKKKKGKEPASMAEVDMLKGQGRKVMAHVESLEAKGVRVRYSGQVEFDVKKAKEKVFVNLKREPASH